MNLLPDMLAAATDTVVPVPGPAVRSACGPTLDRDFVDGFMEQSGVPVTVTDGRVYDVLRAADAAIVASGTATLETGLMAVPMVIVYRISALTYLSAQKLVRGCEGHGTGEYRGRRTDRS